MLEAVQAGLLIGVAAGVYGWRSQGSFAVTLLGLALGTAAFAALGLAMAGRLRAEATLAGANGLYLLFLLLGGGILPLDDLPAPLATLASALPAAALTNTLRALDDQWGSVSRLRSGFTGCLGSHHPARRHAQLPVGNKPSP